MKRIILLALVCLTTLIFSGCANRGNSSDQIQNSLVNEYWMQHINLDPNKWTRRASNWFYTNQPSEFDQYASNSPLSSAITVMTVRVPDFSKLKVEGPFQVQIVGRQPHSSVYILGPNALARHTVTEIRGDTLVIHADSDCRNRCGNLDQVIVRIGMRELNSLSHSGMGYVEGKDIDSSGLDITSNSGGNILLVGNMALTDVSQNGNGTISILGANTPALNVIVNSNGNLNISGRVNIRRIQKYGNGYLNIIGASSDGLVIHSGGSGVTTVVGYTNLRKLSAEGGSRVYLYWVNANGIYLDVHDHAHVGLAGAAGNLDIEADGNAIFQGKYLRVDNIYIRTRGNSHANITPSEKLFASAMDNSSIYFFGAPNTISRYVLGNGAIIPIFSESCPVPQVPRPPAVYKDEGSFAAPVPTSFSSNGGFTPTVVNNVPANPATFTGMASNTAAGNTVAVNNNPVTLAENDTSHQSANDASHPPVTTPAVVAAAGNSKIPAGTPVITPAIPDMPPAIAENTSAPAAKVNKDNTAIAANHTQPQPDKSLAEIAANKPKASPLEKPPVVVAENNNGGLLNNMLAAIASSVSKSRPAKVQTEMAANGNSSAAPVSGNDKIPPAYAPAALAANTAEASSAPAALAANTAKASSAPAALATNTVKPSSAPTVLAVNTAKPSSAPTVLAANTAKPSSAPVTAFTKPVVTTSTKTVITASAAPVKAAPAKAPEMLAANTSKPAAVKPSKPVDPENPNGDYTIVAANSHDTHTHFKAGDSTAVA